MKKSFVFIFVTALALCVSHVCQGQAHKNVKENEANKLAREGSEAAKNQDWDKAVDLFRKASAMDHKYTDELAIVYQRRGYASAEEPAVSRTLSRTSPKRSKSNRTTRASTNSAQRQR